jgi:kynureninase
MEENAFPSDNYAVRSQIRFHGFDPGEALLVVRAREGESRIRIEDLERAIDEHGQTLALVLLGGVQYYSGQLFDLKRIAAAARRRGCAVGFDLAHAAGNVPLALHDHDVDFAVWCTYKYLNAGPGALAGCFVHERHHLSDLPRLAGWWGNDPKTRFRMHLEPEFLPVPGADAWQLSNPPILAAAPLRASLEIFDRVGMEALREKSLNLNAYLLRWIAEVGDPRLTVLTPEDPAQRGCQTSLELSRDGRELFRSLREHGVVGDYREPGVIRIAPVPLYNSFHDVWRFGRALREWAAGG